MSPGAVPAALALTATVGGCRSGRERKLWTCAARPRWTRSGVELIGSFTATAKRSSTVRAAPGPRIEARTCTRSPSAKRRAGRKLAPSPCEYASTRPAWRPVREPVTLMCASSRAGTPRKLICVSGEASRLPGRGEIVTDPACRAESLSLAGVHMGAAAAGAAIRNPSMTSAAGPTMRARMGPIDPNEHRHLDRRTFLKRGLIGGGALVGGGLGIRAVTEPAGDAAAPGPNRTSERAAADARSQPRGRRPNILVILVDQLRSPQWASATPIHLGLP